MRNILPRRTWLLFLLLTVFALYADGIVQERREERLLSQHRADVAVCGEHIANSRNPESDLVAAQLATTIGFSLIEHGNLEMQKRGFDYIDTGLCLGLSTI